MSLGNVVFINIYTSTSAYIKPPAIYETDKNNVQFVINFIYFIFKIKDFKTEIMCTAGPHILIYIFDSVIFALRQKSTNFIAFLSLFAYCNTYTVLFGCNVPKKSYSKRFG